MVSTNIGKEDYVAMKSLDFLGDGWYKPQCPLTPKQPVYNESMKKLFKKIIIPYE